MNPKIKTQLSQNLLMSRGNIKPGSYNNNPINKHLPQYNQLSHKNTKPNQENKDTTTLTKNIPKEKTNTSHLKRARPTGLAQNIDITKHTHKITKLKKKQNKQITINKHPTITSTMTIIPHTTKYKKLPITYYNNTKPQHPTKQKPYKQQTRIKTQKSPIFTKLHRNKHKKSSTYHLTHKHSKHKKYTKKKSI